MNRFEMFKNLMVMAIADGKLTEEELGFLAGRATRWGITSEEYAEAVRSAEHPKAHLNLPADHRDRIEMLGELIRMMAADGELADLEKQLFAVAAAVMQISDKELNQLLDDLLK